MAAGFRKSLFGFNCDDVINYIKKLHANFTEKEKGFKKDIENLNAKIEKVNTEYKDALTKNAELQEKLSEFESKKREMERLSENIGKLYLVAQTNAKSIMNNAEENSRLASEEVAKNITAIDETHEALELLRRSITETSENFAREVDELMRSLSAAKDKIAEDKETESKSKQEFSAILEALSK